MTHSPLQFPHWETAAHLALAALDQGHQVSIFLYLDGVYTPLRHQRFPDLEVLPVDRVKTLLAKGARIVACGLCVNARGLEGGKDFLEGVEIGSLPDFAAILGQADRLVSL